jgi:N-glycosylase/DNA lyase
MGGENEAQTLLLHETLDLDATLYSGQAFRWRRDGARHRGFIDNTPVILEAGADWLKWVAKTPIHEERIRHYFRLDTSHTEFLEQMPHDPFLSRAIRHFAGLRLLRQDPWEALISFIISQNSNEAKIRSSIERLAHIAGAAVDFAGERWRLFPAPAALASLTLADLRSTGLGYRAEYVREAARRVERGALAPHALSNLPYEEAFANVLALPGVGEKVADCVLLYGCDHLQAFPTDVWVRRFMQETYYRPRRRPSHERLQRVAWKRFGPMAGYAQHYLFHYRRAVGRLEASPS